MDLVIKDKKKLELNGVKKVKSTEPSLVAVILTEGSVVINGSDMSVQSISLEKGILELTGNITGVKFSSGTQERKTGWKNIFK